MSPEILAEYLRVARTANVMSLGLVTDAGFRLEVTFGPEAPPADLGPPEPGGWKRAGGRSGGSAPPWAGPHRLDDVGAMEPDQMDVEIGRIAEVEDADYPKVR